MKHVKHGKKLISLLLSAAVAMSMTLSTVMTPLAASSSVSDLVCGKALPASTTSFQISAIAGKSSSR